MKTPLYNQEGKEIGTIELSDAVFGVKPKASVMHQVYVALAANLRRPWAHTKDRGDVRGGGKKPWKQKGTGRARHGSIRSPIWKGGGVTFGPLKERNYKQKINKKMNAVALRMSLSGKASAGQLLVLEDFAADGKTKSFAVARQVLPGSGKSTLLLVASGHEMVRRAAKNVPGVSLARAVDANTVNVLDHQYVITTKQGVAELEKRLAVSRV